MIASCFVILSAGRRLANAADSKSTENYILVMRTIQGIINIVFNENANDFKSTGKNRLLCFIFVKLNFKISNHQQARDRRGSSL